MNATLSDLSPSAIQQIVAAIREGQKPQPTGLILTTTEAIAYVKKESKGAFYAWAKTYGVERSGSDRYPIYRLDAGLQKEARVKFTSKAALATAPTHFPCADNRPRKSPLLKQGAQLQTNTMQSINETVQAVNPAINLRTKSAEQGGEK